MTASTVASELRRLRVQAGLTREVLAERADVSVATLAALERGQRRRPHLHTVVALAEALGLDDTGRTALLELATESAAEPGPATPPPLAPARPVGAIRLPAPPTALIGREAELAAGAAVLDPARSTVRLLTLVGPGGVGKTRLAVAVASSLVESFADGVVFVDLAPLRDHRLVPTAMLRALGLRESGGRSTREQVIEYLRQQHLLLLLDNFEHLVDAAPVLPELLEACPSLVLLVTSRAALRLRSEQQFRVAPIATPSEQLQTIEAVAEAPAVRLFVDRARAAAPEFDLHTGNAHAVAAICRRLDGMPLAIELAAARVRLLQPDVLLQRLERRLPLLTEGAPELPQRQQTLRHTLEWSHDLLRPVDQVLFRRLAAFSGGWTLGAAEAICAGADLAPDEVLETLAELVNNSLVHRVLDANQEPRFGMLETVREYAEEQLIARGELERIRAAHAAFFSRLAEPVAAARTIAPWIVSQSPVLSDEEVERVQAEFDNLQMALGWWETHGEAGKGLRLAVAFHSLWSRLGQYALARRWLEGMLDLADRTAPSGSFRLERAVALTEVGTLAGYQAQNEQARAFHRRSVDVWRELDHASGLAIALANLGLAEWLAGDAQQAVVLLEEANARSRAADVPHTVAITLRNLGLIARAQGEYARAEALISQAAAYPLPPGWFRGYSLARSLSCLGRVACLQHDLHRARALLRQAVEVIREARVTGQALADWLDWQAALEAEEGELARAVRLFGAANTHWQASGARRYTPEEPAYQRDLARVRAGLDEQTFAARWAEGALMAPEQAIAYAVREIDAPALP